VPRLPFMDKRDGAILSTGAVRIAPIQEALVSRFPELLLKICACAKILPGFIPILTVCGLKCRIYLTFGEKNEPYSSHNRKFLATTPKKPATKCHRAGNTWSINATGHREQCNFVQSPQPCGTKPAGHLLCCFGDRPVQYLYPTSRLSYTENVYKPDAVTVSMGEPQ